MNAIMLSVQPKWTELILNGEKTIEVRKTAPKETPFKVYVYCTKGDLSLMYSTDPEDLAWCKPYMDMQNGRVWVTHSKKVVPKSLVQNEKVVAEFICNKVEKMGKDTNNGLVFNYGYNKESCLYLQAAIDYIGNNYYYAYHITDLKIYDKPKELSEFQKRDCGRECNYLCQYYENKYCGFYMSRAPQSWQFVKELK